MIHQGQTFGADEEETAHFKAPLFISTHGQSCKLPRLQRKLDLWSLKHEEVFQQML